MTAHFLMVLDGAVRWQRPLANSIPIQDREPACEPERPAVDNSLQQVTRFSRCRRLEAQKDDTGWRREPVPEHELAEVAVKGYQHAMLVARSDQHDAIRPAHERLRNGEDVMTREAKDCDAWQWEVLVREEPHGLRRVGRDGIDRFVVKDLGREREHRPERIGGQLRVALQHLVLRPAGREEPKQKIDGEARAPDNRLALQNFRIRCDVILPGHGFPAVRQLGQESHYHSNNTD